MRQSQDMTSFPVTSRNPERALMILDKLMTDKDYYLLSQYGIEDLTYEINEDGFLSYDNIDQTVHNFNLNMWAMRNTDLALEQARLWDRQAYEDTYFPLLVFDPFDGFPLILDNVRVEQAAIQQVIAEYAQPIYMGLVPDPEAAVAELRQKMEGAGIAKFQEEIERQIEEFFKTKA